MTILVRLFSVINRTACTLLFFSCNVAAHNHINTNNYSCENKLFNQSPKKPKYNKPVPTHYITTYTADSILADKPCDITRKA